MFSISSIFIAVLYWYMYSESKPAKICCINISGQTLDSIAELLTYVSGCVLVNNINNLRIKIVNIKSKRLYMVFHTHYGGGGMAE